jgi:hypothetical protein
LWTTPVGEVKLQRTTVAPKVVVTVRVDAGASIRLVLPKELTGWAVNVVSEGQLVKLGTVNTRGRTPTLSPPNTGRFSIVLQDGSKKRFIRLLVVDPVQSRASYRNVPQMP